MKQRIVGRSGRAPLRAGQLLVLTAPMLAALLNSGLLKMVDR